MGRSGGIRWRQTLYYRYRVNTLWVVSYVDANTAKHKILRMGNMAISETNGFPRFGFAVSHLVWFQ